MSVTNGPNAVSIPRNMSMNVLLNFSDQTYMSSFFRRMTGMSPIEYRRSVIG